MNHQCGFRRNISTTVQILGIQQKFETESE